MKPGTEGLCVPCKMYGALACGSAILGIVPKDTEIADLIEEYECGIRVEPLQPALIAQAILKLHRDKQLLESLQRHARTCFEQHFTKMQAVEEHARVLESLFKSADQTAVEVC